MFGMTMYTDLFAGDLKKLADKIPYLKEQKLTYLHLMPLLDMPHPNNDGGYAVQDFDTVDPKLGTNEDLAAYFGTPEAPECHMLYNVSIMVNLWSALASRDVRLLKNQIDKLDSLPENCWFSVFQTDYAGSIPVIRSTERGRKPLELLGVAAFGVFGAENMPMQVFRPSPPISARNV